MRQLWREGSQHHWVQSVSQLPHLEMHFQPQLGVLTDAFDPCEPSWDQRARFTVLSCTVLSARSESQPSSTWSGWTGGMWWDHSLWISPAQWNKTRSLILLPGSQGVQHTASQFWLFWLSHYSQYFDTVHLFAISMHDTPHCQHWNTLNYLRPKETQVIAYKEIFWKKVVFLN